MNKIGKNIKKFLKWTVITKAGWALISFLWVCIWLAVDNYIPENWAYWVALPGIAYLAILALTLIVFAWIINPIRELKKRKNKK